MSAISRIDKFLHSWWGSLFYLAILAAIIIDQNLWVILPFLWILDIVLHKSRSFSRSKSHESGVVSD